MELKLVFSGIGIELDRFDKKCTKKLSNNALKQHRNDQNIKRRTNAT
jgi:hypothetical protein